MHTTWLPTTLLVDLPNWVGDQMMALPALDRLVQGNLSGTTVLHTRPNLTRFLSSVFPQAAIVASPRKSSPILSARRLITESGRFEVGVTLRNSARGKILVRLAARHCVGSRGEGALFLMTTSCVVDRARHQVHDADGLLEVIGLDPADPDWTPEVPSEIADEGVRAAERLELDRERSIALAPTTARGTSKRWPAGRFGELANALRQRGWEPLLVVGPGEESTAERVCEAAGFRLPTIGCNLDVAGLAAIVSWVGAVVGNDSGPMQLAAAFGTPVVAIFGPTDPARTAPRGPRHRVVTASTDTGAGMSGISVEEVESAVLGLL